MTQKTTPLKASEILNLRKTAIFAAQTGGEILLKKFQKKLKIQEKPNYAGIVTDADLASESAIVKILKKNSPHFGILTEESPFQKGTSPGRWIVDPLDGTTNFSIGFPMFCVSLAAEWQGNLVACATFHPLLGELYYAARGHGAFLNGKKIVTSKTQQIEKAIFTIGLNPHPEKIFNYELNFFEKIHKNARAIRRSGSACLDLAYVARGTFDAYWERGLAEWDIAAGRLLVTEAGGCEQIAPIPTDGRFEILASNLFLQNSLQQLLISC